MIFPSYIFLLAFLPLAVTGWYAIRSLRWRLFFLTAASYVFYGWWDYRFAFLMLASTLLDYVCGARIHASRDPVVRRRWLIASIAGNLGSLGFFKYYGFFAESAQTLLAALDWHVSPPMLHIVLPLGISFYTFQSMSYTIDIYRNRCAPTRDLLHFMTYVSMFPQLVAGPIVRYSEIEEQLRSIDHDRIRTGPICDGVWLFVIGLVKKVWIADTLAPVAEHAFDISVSPGLFTAWSGALCYTFQLYFDFSAYSDMARGLGLMLGFSFPVNFNSPYKSGNIAEFWNRWHITLSHWLRDYLYIPLGGSRCGTGRTIRNLAVTMLLGGLWHGAAWTFVVWGAFHGVLLSVHAAWKRMTGWRLTRAVAVPLTFGCVVVGWVLFRSGSLHRAGQMLAAMVGANGVEPLSYRSATLGLSLPRIYSQFGGLHGVLFLSVVAAAAFWAPNSEQLPKPRRAVCGVALGVVVAVTLTTLTKPTPFLYFTF